jgi:TfdA family taurine catabolism dioxygenase TauD
MSVETRTRFDVIPLSKHIGAEIHGVDLREKPDEETIRAIYRAWLDHLVIVFPDQHLSQEDLIRVTGYFGELGELSRPAKYFPKGYSRLLPGIMRCTTTITARLSAATAAARRLSPNAAIRCFAPTRTPAAKPSTSIG